MSESHGSTPAAWTAVGIMLVGFLVGGVALPLEKPWMFFAGLAVVVVGAVVGKVMSMMGMGSTVTYKDDHDPEYDRDDQDDEDDQDDRAEENGQKDSRAETTRGDRA